MSEQDRAWIGSKACGCIVFALVDGHASKREIRADLKREIKAGLTIEVTTVGEARKRPNFLVQCPHSKPVPDVDAEVERLLACPTCGSDDPDVRLALPKHPEDLPENCDDTIFHGENAA